MVGIIIAIIATLVISVPVSAYVANTRSKKAMEITIGNAEDKAREIIDEAIKAADAKKREASLEVKEETIKARHDFEKETKERRAELQKYEQRVLSKEETVEKKATTLERKEQSLASKEKNIETEKAQLQELQAKHLQELERDYYRCLFERKRCADGICRFRSEGRSAGPRNRSAGNQERRKD